MALLAEKAVERLSLYRRILMTMQDQGKLNVFSHELATLSSASSAQVRRDIMLLGYSGSPRKGYSISELIDSIGHVLDCPKNSIRVCLVGSGRLGKAILSYFQGKRPKIQIVATFDVDPDKTDRIIAGVNAYHIKDLTKYCKEKNVKVGIITTPSDSAQEVADMMIDGGVTSILNFSPATLVVPKNVFLEVVDITVSLEKAAYYAIRSSDKN